MTLKKIIPGFETVPPREVIDCHLYTFRYLLHFYGLELDPFTLLVLSGGMGFQYGQCLLPKLSNFKIWFAGALLLGFEQKLLDKLRLPHRKFKTSGADAGIAELLGYIDGGIPLLVPFDGKVIPETNLGFSGGAGKLNMSYPSIAALAGYDLGTEAFYITISGNEANRDLYRIKMDEFMKARTEECFPISPDNTCYELLMDDTYRSLFQKNLKHWIVESLVETGQRMVKPDNQYQLPELGIIPLKFYQGVSAMRLFAENSGIYIEELLEKEAAGTMPQQELDTLFALNFLIFRTFFANGSYTCFRGEYGQGLKNVSQRLGISALENIGHRFMELADDWRTFTRMLYYVRRYCDDKRGFAKLLRERITDLAGREERLFNEIIQIFASECIHI